MENKESYTPEEVLKIVDAVFDIGDEIGRNMALHDEGLGSKVGRINLRLEERVRIYLETIPDNVRTGYCEKDRIILAYMVVSELNSSSPTKRPRQLATS